MTQSHTYESLRVLNVAQLREVAAQLDDPAVQGYTQLNKEHLLAAICTALHLEMHVHHEVVGIDKTAIKQRIRALKKERDEALAAKDSARLKKARRQIHHLKRNIHKATV
ncbi:MAG: hypothetical protein AB1505_15180 [Candidatus Latescibacterota bacterium]